MSRTDSGDPVGLRSDADAAWAWLREQIFTRPQWVAQRVGIEQLGYLTELRRPKPLPSLAELEEVWRTDFNKSAEQKRKVLACWRDFKQVLGVTGVRDITPEAAVAFRDAVYAPPALNAVFNLDPSAVVPRSNSHLPAATDRRRYSVRPVALVRGGKA